MIKINYKSDFKINESSETVAMEVPFVFSYYVFDSKKYVVSFDGHNYVNCERKEDGSLDVIFNQPDFGIGHLKVERKYAVDDTAFADGVFDVVTVDKTDVFITSGKTFETYVETLVVPPYLKGDKGDPMTWSTMTETEREELVHDVAEAIDPEMVMTENEKARQEAERSRQTAEQQRSSTFNTLKGEMQSAITAGNTAAGNAQKVVDEYDTKVAEQDSKLTELGSEVNDFKEAVTNQVNNYKPIEINGNVTNAADEEDLTSKDGLLKLKDRSSLNGMGYVILRKNKSFDEQVTLQNTIYEIRYDFNIVNTFKMPKKCVLKFVGGKLLNGTVECDDALIISESDNQIFENVTITGKVNAVDATPNWFGAIGDGVNDDTYSLRKSLIFSSDTGNVINIPIGKKYHVTGTLNEKDGEYVSLALNIKGSFPDRGWEYSVGKYGGIDVALGTTLFKDKEIRGSIKNVSICGVRDNDVCLFQRCDCIRLNIANCNISQFGVIFKDTLVKSCSKIENSIFLTVYRFSICIERNAEFTDSSILNCYINGGEEQNDNDCFGWCNYNGSLVQGNFIDYYRCIYRPNYATKTSSSSLPNSVNNNYQVFRYLYSNGDKCTGIIFNSIGDVFNWTLPSSLDKIANFTPLQYKNQDNILRDMPPYIARSSENDSVIFKSASLQRYIGNVIFYMKTITTYKISKLEFECVDSNSDEKSVAFPENTNANYLIYGGGSYKNNMVDVKGIMRTVTELPYFADGWCKSINGERVKFGNDIYRSHLIYDKQQSKWVGMWINESKQGIVTSGTSSERPHPCVVGFQFFDTTLNKPIWNIGSKAWVDSTGATV